MFPAWANDHGKLDGLHSLIYKSELIIIISDKRNIIWQLAKIIYVNSSYYSYHLILPVFNILHIQKLEW